MGIQDGKNVLIDSNVIINDFIARNAGLENKKKTARDVIDAHLALKRLDRLKTKFYVAPFSIVQLICKFQKLYDVQVIERELQYITSKYHVIKMDNDDFLDCIHRIHGETGLMDIEDDMIFGLAKKTKCSVILTLNVKDFVRYNVGIIILSPRDSINRFIWKM